MAILALVLAARDMDPEVLAIFGFDDGLVEIRVGGQELKPAIQDAFVRVGFVILPVGVSRLRNLDISCFT